jgi:hypothetical protein
MIEPAFLDVKKWFKELDKFGAEPFAGVNRGARSKQRRGRCR